MAEKIPQIFIAHANEDKPQVRELYAKLRQAGNFEEEGIYKRILVFPLYLYPDPNQPQELQQEKRSNFFSPSHEDISHYHRIEVML